jgi:hypothetical protein
MRIKDMEWSPPFLNSVERSEGAHVIGFKCEESINVGQLFEAGDIASSDVSR